MNRLELQNKLQLKLDEIVDLIDNYNEENDPQTTEKIQDLLKDLFFPVYEQVMKLQDVKRVEFDYNKEYTQEEINKLFEKLGV